MAIGKTALAKRNPAILVDALPAWLAPHAPGQELWFNFPLQDGKIVEGMWARREPVPPEPDTQHRLYGQQLVKLLNGHIAADGLWVVAWSDWPPKNAILLPISCEPRLLIMAWFDADLDMQAIVDSQSPFFKMGSPGAIEGYVQDCAKVLEHYLRDWKKRHDVRPQDQIKATLGQTSADARAVNPIMPFDLQ